MPQSSCVGTLPRLQRHRQRQPCPHRRQGAPCPDGQVPPPHGGHVARDPSGRRPGGPDPGRAGRREIYQAAGAENAAIHLIEDPVLLEIRGRLLSLLDEPTTVAVFGHELGHFLCHGPSSPHGTLNPAAAATVTAHGVPMASKARASTYLMACEFTADRFGLLACQDLDAALRPEMVVTTGLSAESLTWDTQAYLAQCRDLVERSLAEGDRVRGITHPEHGMRAWALWLFSETDLYKQLTGQGPGTRTVQEVDAQIARLMAMTPDAEVLQPWMGEEPVAEVHECALASAVLVALADDVLAEEESDAIERVFAPLVDDWQRYLVWDEALDAFRDTGAVVIRGGVASQRAVFHLLVHVLAADGEVKDAEISMICGIGDALRCGTLYRYMLTPVLQTLGVDVPDLAAVDKPIPMPARASEAEEALRIHLRGLARRGGRTTLRRLLTMLGAKEPNSDHLATITRIFDEVGLLLDTDLYDVEIDEVLTPERDPRHALELRAEAGPTHLRRPRAGAPAQGLGPATRPARER